MVSFLEQNFVLHGCEGNFLYSLEVYTQPYNTLLVFSVLLQSDFAELVTHMNVFL